MRRELGSNKGKQSLANFVHSTKSRDENLSPALIDMTHCEVGIRVPCKKILVWEGTGPSCDIFSFNWYNSTVLQDRHINLSIFGSILEDLTIGRLQLTISPLCHEFRLIKFVLCHNQLDCFNSYDFLLFRPRGPKFCMWTLQIRSNM